MNFEPSREYVEAVLLMRSTAQFQRVVTELRQYRDQLLLATMTAPPEYVEKARHRAGAIHDILSTIDNIEELRQQIEHGQAETGTEGIRAG